MHVPRFFRRGIVVPALILAVTAPRAEAAHGVVDVSWETCSPVTADIASPAAGPLRLVASLLGNDQTHNAYQVRFQLGDPSNQVPDAWRFDAPGCQGQGLIAINHLPPAHLAAACPAFQGNGISLQIKDYDFMPPTVGLPTTLMRGTMASTYPNGETADPAQRYHLADFVFDHTFSVAGATTPGVNCGGFETMIIVKLLIGPSPTGNQCSYLRQVDGIEFPFEPGNVVATVNGSVPAEQTTWGQIKSVYRR